jgi:hypothetical protein
MRQPVGVWIGSQGEVTWAKTEGALIYGSRPGYRGSYLPVSARSQRGP